MRISSFSHCGNHQVENQDCICVNEAVVVIADGMGGLPWAREVAEFASNETVRRLQKELQKNSNAEQVIEQVLTIVNEKSQSQYPGSGTTLSMLIMHRDTVWCCNIGDSKSYAIKDGVISKISVGQNLAEQSGLSIHSKILTNYIGLAGRRPAFIQSYTLVENSTYILCTDGVTDAIDLNLALTGHEYRNSEIISNLIEAAAHDADPKDNYSAVIIQF